MDRVGPVFRPAGKPVGPVGAASVFLALAVLHTWPLLSPPWRQALTYHADVQLNAWIVGWIAHAIATDPFNLFNGNIFWPEAATIAYSDPLVVPALIVAPVLWLGGSPVLAFNLTDTAGLVLTAMATWWVIRRWTGSGYAGLVAGALAAFNVHTGTRLAHLAATHAWGLPLAWYLADTIAREPRPRHVVALAAVVAATAATSLYLLAFVCLIVSVVAIVHARSWRGIAAVGGSAVAGFVIATPVLLPYLRMAASGLSRPIEMVEQFSATWSGYLVSTSHIHAAWSRTLFTNDVNVYFAGASALVLAGAGVAVSLAGDRTSRRRALACLALGTIGVVLSLGPSTGIYRWLYDVVTPLQGLRAAARFGYVFLLVVALCAGLGVAAIERKCGPCRGMVLSLVALALVTAEAWSGPVKTTSFDGVSGIYRHVADAPDPVRLVEVPFYPPELVFENGEYVLNATAHWKPLLNGYSGYTPDSYRRRTSAFWSFPEAWAIDAMKAEGVTHVMVHLERFTADENAAIALALRDRADLRLVASDTHGHRLYVVVRE